jgi:hypothetical protein
MRIIATLRVENAGSRLAIKNPDVFISFCIESTIILWIRDGNAQNHGKLDFRPV